MATKVFISWSGDLSNKLAEAVRQWLPSVLQFVKPYFTPSDIEKGTRWGSDISSELDSSDIGIICLTKENLNKPWILFEAGALSKNFDKAHVCTLLFNVDSTDLTGPLTLFQNTQFDKKDFKKLVKTINNSGGDTKLDESVLDEVFDMWWPKLEKEVGKILKDYKPTDSDGHRTERDLLEEVLELTRLGMRRSRGDTGVSQEVMRDLIEGFGELSRSMECGNFEEAYSIMRQIEKPLSYICRRSSPDLYKRFKMIQRRRVEFADDNEIDDDTLAGRASHGM